jgi:hypothetical protein
MNRDRTPLGTSCCSTYCSTPSNFSDLPDPDTPSDLDFPSALGGIRTPNLLIRRRVPPSQAVPPVPAEYDNRHRKSTECYIGSSRPVPPVAVGIAPPVPNPVPNCLATGLFDSVGARERLTRS